MHRTAARVALGLALPFAFTGCRSHEAKVADLQKQYDQMGKQYGKDCESELIKVPPKLSPKCAAEKQKLADTWNRLQAERERK
jgi:hypothetical protein